MRNSPKLIEIEKISKLLIFGLSVWISNQFTNGYWVIGPVFGAVVLAYNRRAAKQNLPLSAVFLAASTLIYALVFRISMLKWGDDSKLFEYVIGPFPVAIVTGSILLPMAHRILLRESGWFPTRLVLYLIGSFYLVIFLVYLSEAAGINHSMPWMPILIAVWQGTYLYFSKKNPKEKIK